MAVTMAQKGHCPLIAVVSLQKQNSERHYQVVIVVANCSDCHYNLPQKSLPGSGVHCFVFTVYIQLSLIHI